MSVFQASNLTALPNFIKQQEQLAIVERKPLDGADVFFEKLMKTSFKIAGKVSKFKSIEDIQDILAEDISHDLQDDPFYARWVLDMAQVCRVFCDILGDNSVGFCLGTERGCRRYHVDNVPMRLLVTYAGQGTEWLPDEAIDRRAFVNGAPNEDIVIDPNARQFLNDWDVAVFRGGAKGLLHRTPDIALKESSILMRLDHSSFWDNILKQKHENLARTEAA